MLITGPTAKRGWSGRGELPEGSVAFLPHLFQLGCFILLVLARFQLLECDYTCRCMSYFLDGVHDPGECEKNDKYQNGDRRAVHYVYPSAFQRSLCSRLYLTSMDSMPHDTTLVLPAEFQAVSDALGSKDNNHDAADDENVHKLGCFPLCVMRYRNGSLMMAQISITFYLATPKRSSRLRITALEDSRRSRHSRSLLSRNQAPAIRKR